MHPPKLEAEVDSEGGAEPGEGEHCRVDDRNPRRGFGHALQYLVGLLEQAEEDGERCSGFVELLREQDVSQSTGWTLFVGVSQRFVRLESCEDEVDGLDLGIELALAPGLGVQGVGLIQDVRLLVVLRALRTAKAQGTQVGS